MCDTTTILCVNVPDQPPCQLEVPLPPQRCATAGQRNMAVRNDCVCGCSCDVWRVLTVCRHTGSGEAFTMATAEIAAELVKAYNANRTVNLTRIKATVAGKHNLSHVPKVLFSLVCILGVRLEMHWRRINRVTRHGTAVLCLRSAAVTGCGCHWCTSRRAQRQTGTLSKGQAHSNCVRHCCSGASFLCVTCHP